MAEAINALQNGTLPGATPFTTTTMPNPITSGDMTVIVLSADNPVLAIALEGDAFPRMIMASDLYDGIYFGDGTVDPYVVGTSLYGDQENIVLNARPNEGVTVRGGAGAGIEVTGTKLSVDCDAYFSGTLTVGMAANTQTASYTLALTDACKAVEMNVAGANTLTVPPNSSVAFPIGSVVEVFQLGAGQCTITPGAGVTIRSDGAKLKTTAQYATVGLRKRATDEWVASGDLSA